MNDLDKARHLLGHWIEHGREHAAAYEEWARKVENLEGGAETASALRKAADKLYESVACLMSAPHEHQTEEVSHGHTGHHDR